MAIPNDDLTSDDIEPEANLLDADLSNAFLPTVNLSDANLRDADLSSANLFDADLSGADLSGADLSNTCLVFADFSDTILQAADLSGADLSATDLSNKDLMNSSLKFRIAIQDTGLLDSDLSEVDRDINFSGADLRDINFSSMDLRGADLSNADLRSVNFRSTDLRNANLRSADLRNADLYDSNLRNADLHGTDLRNTDLSKADLSLATLSSLTLNIAITIDTLPKSTVSWDSLAQAYHDLKIEFKDQGLDEGARNMYFLERQARTKEALANRDIILILGAVLSRYLTGYGVRVTYVVGWTLGVLVFTTLWYAWVGGQWAGGSLYYSLVTLVTSPPHPPPISGGLKSHITMLIVLFETYFGTVLVVLLGYVLSNRDQI